MCGSCLNKCISVALGPPKQKFLAPPLIISLPHEWVQTVHLELTSLNHHTSSTAGIQKNIRFLFSFFFFLIRSVNK